MNPEVAYSSLLENSAAVGQIILIAMLLERALAFVFEYHWFAKLSQKVEGLKAPLTFGLALVICRVTNMDILAELFREEGAPVVTTWIGSFITAGVIAGGSAGVMALFQNWFNWSRESRKNNVAAKAKASEALLKEAEARATFAESEIALANARLVANRGELARAKVGAGLGPGDVGKLDR